MSLLRDLDFEVMREPWNKYSLADGAYLRAKYVLQRFRKGERDAQNQQKIDIKGQPIVVIYALPETLRGQPATHPYSQEEIQQATKEEVRYTTLEEEWNEYVLEDGDRIRIKGTVASVSRTNLRDMEGEPIYTVDSSMIVQGTPRPRSVASGHPTFRE